MLSAVWTLVIGAAAWSEWPTADQAYHHPAFIYRLEQKQRDLLSPEGTSSNGTSIAMPNGHLLQFKEGVQESAFAPVARAYHEIATSAQAEHRRRHLLRYLAIALIPCLVLACLGLGFAWVRRGFEANKA